MTRFIGPAIALVLLTNLLSAAVVIMPLGDSITQGRYDALDASKQHTGYSAPLQAQLLNAGIDYEFAGSLDVRCGGDVPDGFHFDGFDKRHEGHWGWRADEILNGSTGNHCGSDDGTGKLSTWIDGYSELPDLVLVHLGTNDIIQDLSSIDVTVNQLTPSQIAATRQDIEDIIDQLKDRILPTKPDMKILLSSLIPGTLIDMEVQAVNMEIEDIAANDSSVIFVDQYSGFNAATHTYDGLHPKSEGEELMADRWFGAIQSATAMPEPNSLLLLGMVGILVAFRSWRGYLLRDH